MFYIVQYNGYCIIKLLEILYIYIYMCVKDLKNVKDLKYGMVIRMTETCSPKKLT